jgi:hypothetical protein
MNVQEFITGTAAISELQGVPLYELSMQAEHDQVWVGACVEDIPSAVEQAKLEEFGFFFDEDCQCWSCYV